jgi:hypothetical protein
VGQKLNCLIKNQFFFFLLVYAYIIKSHYQKYIFYNSIDVVKAPGNYANVSRESLKNIISYGKKEKIKSKVIEYSTVKPKRVIAHNINPCFKYLIIKAHCINKNKNASYSIRPTLIFINMLDEN